MIFINSNQLLKMINEGRLTLIIDVRDEEDYMLGHIPNAVNTSVNPRTNANARVKVFVFLFALLVSPAK